MPYQSEGILSEQGVYLTYAKSLNGVVTCFRNFTWFKGILKKMF